MEIKFLRLTEVQAHTPLQKCTIYKLIARGLFPPSIKIGLRAAAWLESEINAINAARAAGKPERELKALVKQLIANRQSGGTHA